MTYNEYMGKKEALQREFEQLNDDFIRGNCPFKRGDLVEFEYNGKVERNIFSHAIIWGFEKKPLRLIGIEVKANGESSENIGNLRFGKNPRLVK